MTLTLTVPEHLVDRLENLSESERYDCAVSWLRRGAQMEQEDIPPTQFWQHVFSTQKKRARRSSSGTYRLFFELLDADRDGEIDTLQVVSIRHAAARSIWQEDSEA